MTASKTLPDDLEPVVAFHGHLCPGVIIGYRVARAAMERGVLTRAEDEEIVAQVENDSCAVDAIQYMAGCTSGKGNLIFKDHGKQSFTFWNRTSGSHIRIAMKIRPAQLLTDEEQDEDQSRVRQFMCERLLTASDEELFHIGPAQDPMPSMARIVSTIPCQGCGEPVMESRARIFQGEIVCIPCLKREECN
jgi:formylmethanofuran dehydrogenase subunit E